MTIPDEFISAIKDKQELRGLDKEYIVGIIEKYYSDKSKPHLEPWNPRNAKIKNAIKEIRAVLREVYGVFQRSSHAQREALLLKYKDARGSGEKLELLDSLLKSHQSTYERAHRYTQIYKQIFSEIKNVQSILDLGCGFNPLSYRWLGCRPKYLASDIGRQDLNLIKQFFEIDEIEGEVQECNLIDTEDRAQLFSQGPWDLVFMFKLVDTLESQERNVSKKIIEELLGKAQHIIISFSTISISGKKMREGGKENWFTHFLETKDLEWKTLNFEGEEFYIIDAAA